jgi:hypothetical protein
VTLLLFCFGQCSSPAFTVFPPSTPFQAMQLICFYRFPSLFPFSGNAAHLLLPFSLPLPLFRPCSPPAFTVFLPSTPFRAMQQLKVPTNKIGPGFSRVHQQNLALILLQPSFYVCGRKQLLLLRADQTLLQVFRPTAACFHRTLRVLPF